MTLISRREGLGLAALAAGAAAAPALAQSSGTKPSFITKIDYKNPEFLRDTIARISSDIDPTKQKLGWIKGHIYGVRPNEAVRTLLACEGFSLVRTRRLPDGSYRRLLVETVAYRDVETDKILTTWHNPYTNENVRVVPIANNPYNTTVSAYDQQGRPNFAGKWIERADGYITNNRGVNLFYPNALSPDKWVRESAGYYNQVSEYFNYTVKRSDIENPNLTSLPVIGGWSRVTPWLPWMLMGTAPGHCVYFTEFGTIPGGIDGLKLLPQDLVEYARSLDKGMLNAPTVDEPNESSLEAYAKEQTPAPVLAGWTPPQPPPPPVFKGDPKDLGNQWVTTPSNNNK